MLKKKSKSRLVFGSVLFVFFVCKAFLIFAFSDDWEPIRGEYKRLIKNRVFLVGEIVSLNRILKHRPGGANLGTDSEDISVCKESSGKVWHFIDNDRGRSIRKDPKWLGKSVRLYGWKFEDALEFEVDTCTILASDGLEVPLRFCSSCKTLVPESSFIGFLASISGEIHDRCSHTRHQ